jgi:hypothetical protein
MVNNINLSELSDEELLALQPTTISEGQALLSGLSDEELLLLGSDEPLPPQTETEWDTFLWNEAKKGVGDTLALGEAVLDTFIIDPVKYLIEDPSVLFKAESYGLTQDEEGSYSYNPITSKMFKSIGGDFITNLGKEQEVLAGFTGADLQMQPSSFGQKSVGMGVRFAADPASLFLGPMKAASIIGREVGSFTAGLLAPAGGEVGKKTEKALFGTESGVGEFLGSLTAAVGGGTATLPTQAAITNIATAVVKPKVIADKIDKLKANIDTGVSALNQSAVKNFLTVVAKEEGVKELPKIIEEFNKISQWVSKENAPLLVALSNNPAMASRVTSLAKRDPDFRRKIESELAEVTRNLNNKLDEIFGTRYASLPETIGVTASISARQEVIKQQRQKLDEELENLTLGLEPRMTPEQQGTAILKLVEKREKLVRQEMSPMYTNLINEATTAGVVMPGEAVNSIYKFVVNNKLDDVFGKGTKLDKIILSFKPKQLKDLNTGNVIVNPTTGKPIVKYPALSFKQVDSLKRAINELKRKPLSQTEKRLIEELDDVVRNARNSIPGKYSAQLDALDKIFYERLGIPYNTQGIKEINAKKYADEISPVILKNETALDDFLNVTGKEGAEIARNAYLAKINKDHVKDGRLDIVSLKRAMKKDKHVINKIDGLEQELKGVIVNHGSLQTKIKELDLAVADEGTKIAAHFLTKSGLDTPSYKDLASSIMGGDISKLNTFMGQVKVLPPKIQEHVLQAVRRQVIAMAQKNSAGATKYLNDPERKESVIRLFGATYIKDLEKSMKFADAVTRSSNTIAHLGATVTHSDLQTISKHLPGLDIPYVSSQVRDRISSTPMKVIRILSRMRDAGSKVSTDTVIGDLLLSKDAISKVAKLSDDLGIKLNTPTAVKKLMDTLGEIYPTLVYGGVKEPIIAQTERERLLENPEVRTAYLEELRKLKVTK